MGSSTPSTTAMEEILLADDAIKQAKVFFLDPTLPQDQLEQAVAISLTEADATAVKRARKSLVKQFGKGNVSKKWFVLDDLPTNIAVNSDGKEESVVDEDTLRQRILAPEDAAAAGSAALGESASVLDRLRQIISGVLKLPIVEVTPEESFIKLGGDSITAIEVMTRSVDAKIFVRVPDIMRSESISDLASSVAPVDPESVQGIKEGKVANEIFASSVVQIPEYWQCEANWTEDEERDHEEIQVGGKVAETLIAGTEKVSRTLSAQVCTAAIVDAFRQTFTDRETLAVLVSAGDSELEKPMPLDLVLSRDNGTFTQTVRSMRDSFAAGEAMSRLSALDDVPAVEVSILYHSNEKDATPSTSTPKPLLSVDAVLNAADGTISVTFKYPKNKFSRKSDITSWAAKCYEILCSGVPSLPSPATLYSLSDFPLLALTYPELDQFISEAQEQSGSDVQAAYPCSSVQNGILIGQLKKPEIYRIDIVFEVKNAADPSQGVHLDRLEDAWRRLVEYHDTLRTVFTSTRGGASFDQVVLRSIDPDIVRITETPGDGEDAKRILYGLDKLVVVNHKPAHRLTTSKSQDGRVFCKLEVSHALVDGMSGSILFRDFGRAYVDQLPKDEQGPSFERFVEFLQGKSNNDALNYWLEYLDGIEPCNFPTIADNAKRTKEAEQMETVPIELEGLDVQGFCKSQGITFATLMQGIWSTVLRAYTLNDDVCFGYLSSGRDDTSVKGLQDMVGVLIHLLLCRVKFSDKDSFSDVLKRLHDERGPSMENQFVSLADIQHSLALGEARLFNTLMSIIFPPPMGKEEVENIEFDQLHNITATEYDLALIIEFRPTGLCISLQYYRSVISDIQAKSLASSFNKILRTALDTPSVKAKQISILSAVDEERLLQDNTITPKVSQCTHDLIAEQIKNQPDAPAIHSWDGHLSYAELGALVNRLAKKLQEMGVGPETIVPVCFPKSTWATVAMIAVEFAGGAFTPLDPTQPKDRLKSILSDTQAKLALAAPDTQGSLEGLDVEVFLVDEEHINALTEPSSPIKSGATPENASFMLFTSGSTGKPKGIIHDHSSFCSTANGYGRVMNIGPASRVFQFSAYTFDIGIMDTLTTLINGGCICIPSADERVNDIEGAINRSKANWVFLTPTVAELINPEECPTMELVCLGGEAVTNKAIDRWTSTGKVNVVGGYGPAESSICAANMDLSKTPKPTNIGRPIASNFWVCDPADPRQLVPIGCIGEMIIEGSLLARGYVNVDEQARASWMEDVDWLPGGGNRRAYRSGDLVRRNEDGTFDYVGRKDTQVKLNGQRIEMGEVEAHLLDKLPKDMFGVVDVVKGEDGSQDTLFAFIWFTSGPNYKDQDLHLPEETTEDIKTIIKNVGMGLHEALPSYMIPAIYPVFYGQPPKTTSLKVDRRSLNAIGKTMTPQQRLKFSSEGQGSEPPTTPEEFKLRDMWAEILHISPEDIGKHDSFLRVGGDSVSAIQLVKIARENKISLTVAKIFESPQLSKMAASAGTEQGETSHSLAPFSMLEGFDGEQMESLKEEIRSQSGLTGGEEIEDAYPCTKLQEGLMALAVKQPGSYIAKNIYRIPDQIDLGKFKAAWEKTVELCAILRTRIINNNGLPVQAVIKEEAHWETTDGKDLASFMPETGKMEMQYGSSLCRYATVQDGKKSNYFVWIIHHAAFDGWTMNVVLETLERVYRDLDTSNLQPYAGFIKYTTEIDAQEATGYWSDQLSEARRATWPPLESKKSDDTAKRESSIVKKTIPFPKPTSSSITRATILRAAWAITLARWCDSDDITFGTTVSGRQAPVAGIETMAGPMIATVPIRTKLDKAQKLEDYLDQVQKQSQSMTQFEQFGLQNISKVGPDAHEACEFSSLLVIQPADIVKDGEDGDEDAVLVSGGSEKILAEEAMRNYFSYPLVLQSHVLEDAVNLIYVFDTDLVNEQQLDAFSHQFSNVIQQLLNESQSSTIGHVAIAGDYDLQQSIEWNKVAEDTQLIDSTIHGLIERQAEQRPDAPAIHAWDGHFSYAEFNAAANRLAHYLVNELGVKADDFVHVCFEKSAWHFVSILAINKAGAAWVPLDPSHPPHRLQQIVSQTKASVCLVSPQNKNLCKDLVSSVIEVTPSLGEELAKDATKSQTGPKTGATPRSAVYTLFTSGSTGTPKGFVMEHRSVATSQTAVSKRLGLSPEVRMLQFAAFVFDLSIGEIIAPLINGACLCIPSEHTRMNDIKGYITENKINWAFLTPAYARTLSPDAVPGLELLLLAGEAVPRDVFDKWFGKVRFVNGWGPAETCVFSTLQEWQSRNESPLTVGKPVGGFCWIVDPEDPLKLAPVGTLGEIVIQGPTILREYLADPERTAATTLKSLPDWAPRRNDQGWGRFYKSGDLGHYNADGTIEFSSRKDTQVKIRGLRVELGEVEHHIQSALEGIKQVAVDVFKTDAGANLVSYLCWNDKTQSSSGLAADDVFEALTEERQNQITSMVGEISVHLPRYMIPSMFIPCRFMPSITSTKLDRKGLNKMVSGLSQEQLGEYALQSGKKRAPETPMESRLQLLWAEILNIPAESIGRDDSFLRIGGDSIAAIHLASVSRDVGVSLTVKDIFDDPRLSAVASKAKELSEDDMSTEIAPFSLITEQQKKSVDAEVVQQCSLGKDQSVEDAYPTTSLQAGLMALAVKQPGSYVAEYTYKVPKRVDIARFKKAWEQLLEHCPNLRTRIVMAGDSTFQAVITNEAKWENTEDLNIAGALAQMKKNVMVYGSRLTQYGFATDKETNDRYFVWRLHHAVFDGWSLRLMLQTLFQAYDGGKVDFLQPFSGFIKYTESVDKQEASDWWQSNLQDAKRADFPPLPQGSKKTISKKTQTRLELPQLSDSSITMATLLRTAWAVVLARYCDTDDVTFGTAISGRQAPVHGLETMTGLMVATVPVRAKLDGTRSVHETLKGVQSNANEMIPYEQFGLQQIGKLGADIQEAIDFSSLLVVQPANHLLMDTDDNTASTPLTTDDAAKDAADSWREGYFSYPLVVQAMIYEDHVNLLIIYDASMVSDSTVSNLSQHFANVTSELVTKEKQPLSDVSISGQQDLDFAIKSNYDEPEIIEDCIHHMFEKQAAARSDAQALAASDGNFTYKELNEAANRLAHHLVTQGVKAGDFVPLCFEKSAWFFVAILAINKAGGAWVPLDPSHPPQRVQQVVGQTGAQLALSSPSNIELVSSVVSKVVEVSASLDAQLTKDQPKGASAHGPEVNVTPEHAVYVLFTSGSTGMPKGLVMQHGSVSTAQTAIGKRLRITPDVRMLQFAAFVFDLCIGEIICPLIHGATLCIPDEHTRMNGLRDFIKNKAINWMFLTPAFARTLKPEEVPGVELLLLAGEAVSKDVFDTWVGKVRFINGWGPAETCCFSTLQEWSSPEESPMTVGAPVGAKCWIVDPNDPTKLAPTGTIGEVVLQGPTLLREYLSDPTRTKAATVTELPAWAPNKESKFWNRFYKSGDLCYYNLDGTLEFSSRKDTQVKIRGLRVELGEVEHHIRECLQGVKQVAVDVFRTEAGANLVAYFSMSDKTKTVGLAGSQDEAIFGDISEDLQRKLTAMVGELSVTLPRYMVPSMFIPCQYMPSITSTKLDRNTLKRKTSELDQEALARYSLQGGEKRAPETAMESKLQLLWAEILNIPAETIGRDDSFLRIGGDSIAAIRLVSNARDAGLSITVKDIFDDPRLFTVASKAVEVDDSDFADITPFSLLDESTKQIVTDGQTIQEEYGLEDDQVIEDSYPCAKLQEGLMALAVKQPGSYIAKYLYEIPERTNVEQFKKAWEQTLETCINLRTRIVLINGQSIQIVIKEDARWDDTDGMDVDRWVKHRQRIEMGHGDSLCRYAIVKDTAGKSYFHLVIHHAIYDGWSMRIALDFAQKSYHGHEDSDIIPYSNFIKYVQDMKEEDAQDYWKDQLRGSARADFPPRKKTTTEDKTTQLVKKRIEFPATQGGDSAITKATILRAAWSMVLARYSDAEDVTFGTTVSGRNAAVPGIESMPGPVIATVPVHIRTTIDKTVKDFLKDVQGQAIGMVPFEQYGIQNITAMGEDFKEACDFSTLLVIQPVSHFAESEDSILVDKTTDDDLEEAGMSNYFSYPLVVQGHTHDDYAELFLIYDADVLSRIQMEILSEQFDNVVQQLLKQDDTPVTQVSIAGETDLQRALKTNVDTPEIIESTIHEMVAAQARRDPKKLAISSWDADLTYEELDRISTRLARYLIDDFNVKKREIVHACFEKSFWYVVSIIAINKAGATWSPLDPAHPHERNQAVVGQTKSRLLFCSPQTEQACKGLVEHVLPVNQDLYNRLDAASEYKPLEPIAGPDDVAYVLFTSGSTGTPKGLVMEHGAACTAQVAHGKRLGAHPDIRMLNFAAYVFDLSVGEIFLPLMHGGTSIFPSEEDRMNGLAQFMHDKNIDWCYLTPSLARTIRPDQVPNLKVMVLAGEAVSRETFELWAGKVRLVNGWGPAETCVFSTLHEWKSTEESLMTIGQQVGGYMWVVDPKDPKKLAPYGTLGEVVIQGPTIMKEYISEPQKTKDSIVDDLPDWAYKSPTHPEKWSRFFKSGDLASFNPDGTLEFASRKDTQVKINGLRVELGEVEHALLKTMPNVKQGCVDVYKGPAGVFLVAFFSFTDAAKLPGEAGDQSLFTPMTEDLQSMLTEVVGQLGVKLPRYMVPRIFVPCNYMPFVTSGKMDRRTLKTAMAKLSREEINGYSLSGSGKKRAPETEKETRMQQLWCDILKQTPDQIGRDDNFLQIGGDSIAAMQLVTKARENGLQLTVKQIFDDPRLSSLAAQATETEADNDTIIPPFGLLSGKTKEAVMNEVESQCDLPNSDLVEDAYPTTSLQEGLMVLAMKQPGSYLAKYIYEIPDHVDVARFRAAWEATVVACGNLRTRIMRAGDETVQAVVKDDIKWDTLDMDLRSAIAYMKDTKVGYGLRLTRYGIVQDQGSNYFIWIVHHTIFDGWSAKLILTTFHEAYESINRISPLVPYSGFIKYTEDLKNDDAADFWKTQLQDAQRATFPTLTPLDPEVKGPGATGTLNTSIAFPAMTAKSTITKATVIRAAWAIILSRYSDSEDITFGATVSGRNAPVPGLEMMAGLTIATVPVRVKLDKSQSTQAYLEQIQSQASELIAYEQYGIQNITKLSPDAKDACEFSSLLLIQPAVDLGGGDDPILRDISLDTDVNDIFEGFFSYPLVLQGHVGAEQVDLTFSYQSNIVSESQLQAVSHQFEHVVKQLLGDEKPLSDVSIAGDWDLQRAIEWTDEPQLVDDCVFNLISEKASHSPDKDAIYSTDGSISFANLEKLSSQLATYLTKAGVKKETIVPICFEKSRWTIVVMLGIMKAGGVFVPIDPEHPVSRRKALVEDVSGQVMIVSSKSAESCQGLADTVIEFSEELRTELSNLATDGFSKPSPENTAYVLFTSGSTGKPKALTMQHSALCSSIAGHGKSYGLSEESRVLQFSNYVFDVSLGEIFTTLANGGTVCVPSDQERLSGIASFIDSAKVDVAMLTTSFVRTFTPEQVPTLKTLIVGGEAPARDTLQVWFDKVKLINGYGPAEACIYCCTNVFQSKSSSPTTIGKGANHAAWIVDADNHNILTPVGCTGELMLHGYALSKGYISNEEMTKASFVDRPEWMPKEMDNEKKRFYKTGDLVRYNADGTLEYLGRRDRQVKVRGQRIELAEIEHAVKKVDERIDHAAVDMLKKDGKDMLVAFVSLHSASNGGEEVSGEEGGHFVAMTDELRKTFSTISDSLKDVLPSYMVPTLFLPVRDMPFVSAMKLDRKKLKSYGDELTKEQISSFSLASKVKAELKTDMERNLRSLWAEVIGCEAEEIGRTDSFLRVGGDSITAIQLVSLAQENGINLNVTTIFQDPKLSAMAAAAESATANAKSYDTQPFELLPEGATEKIKEEVLKQSNLPQGTVIQDAYPTTSLQDGLVALSVKQPGSYIANHMYKIPEGTDIDKLKAAWEKTVESCDNLRMRVIRANNKSYQALIKDDIHWETENISSAEEYETAKASWEMTYGTPLSRYAIIRDPSGTNYFSWVVHHAAFDGWTIQVVIGTLNNYYREQVPELPPYSQFIKYVSEMDQEETATYWRNQLQDAKKASFPPPKVGGAKDSDVTKETKHLTKKIPLKLLNTSLTKASVVRAAWAMVLARYCGTDDVTFGTTVSGRNASIPGIQGMAGPMVATVPVRVHVDSKRSVTKFVQDIQNQANEMTAYEQYGLQNISKVSEEAKDACDFSSLLVIQPYQRMTAISGGEEKAILEHANGEENLDQMVKGFFNYPLVFQAIVSEDEIDLLVFYDPSVLKELQLQTLMEQVGTRITQLAEKLEKKSEKSSNKDDGEKSKKKKHRHADKDGDEKKHKKSSKEKKEKSSSSSKSKPSSSG